MNTTQSTATLRALVVEDNPADVALLKAHIATAPPGWIELQTAHTLEDAAQHLRFERFDVVLLDLSLPGSQGLDTFRFVHERCREAAIVVLSGLADETVAREAVRSGAQDYLVKDGVDANVLFRSVTYSVERRRITQRALKLQAELEHARKLATIGRITAGIAHEIRNPLQIVAYSANALAKRLAVSADEKSVKDIERIRSAAVRGERFVQELLEYGGDMTLRKTAVHLGVVLGHVAEDQDAAADEGGVRVTFETVGDLRGVVVDPHRIEQVLVNLVTNAVKQTGEGGVVAIRCERDSPTTVTVEVLDMGPGIEPEHLEHVFEPFFTLRAGGVGTGLGLAICKAIVEAHGGEITLANAPAGGALARVRLPVSGAAEA